MNFSWFVPIDKLMYWRGATWLKLETRAKNLILRVHYDQLLIVTDEKVIESLNMHSRIKGIYKDDILILIVWTKEQDIRKIKFHIRSNVGLCLQKLGEHFPIISHNTNRPTNVMKSKYSSLEVVIKHALDRKDPAESLKIPPCYSNFVKLCLLDPAFPQMVTETEKILNNFNK